MPIKCHICQLLHAQIWDHSVQIYISYELTAMNNVIRSNAIHAFHITGRCPA